MNEDEFDTRTRANMEVALDRVCSRRSSGEDHKVRKLVAKHILRCAQNGQTTLSALTAAGESALAKKRQPKNKSA
jgi:hypothetical protein